MSSMGNYRRTECWAWSQNSDNFHYAWTFTLSQERKLSVIIPFEPRVPEGLRDSDRQECLHFRRISIFIVSCCQMRDAGVHAPLKSKFQCDRESGRYVIEWGAAEAEPSTAMPRIVERMWDVRKENVRIQTGSEDSGVRTNALQSSITSCKHHTDVFHQLLDSLGVSPKATKIWHQTKLLLWDLSHKLNLHLDIFYHSLSKHKDIATYRDIQNDIQDRLFLNSCRNHEKRRTTPTSLLSVNQATSQCASCDSNSPFNFPPLSVSGSKWVRLRFINSPRSASNGS